MVLDIKTDETRCGKIAFVKGDIYVANRRFSTYNDLNNKRLVQLINTHFDLANKKTMNYG